MEEWGPFIQSHIVHELSQLDLFRDRYVYERTDRTLLDLEEASRNLDRLPMNDGLMTYINPAPTDLVRTAPRGWEKERGIMHHIPCYWPDGQQFLEPDFRDLGLVSTHERTREILSRLMDIDGVPRIARKLRTEKLIAAAKVYGTGNLLRTPENENSAKMLMASALRLNYFRDMNLPKPGIALRPAEMTWPVPGVQLDFGEVDPHHLSDANRRGKILWNVFEDYEQDVEECWLDLLGTAAEEREIRRREKDHPWSLFSLGLYQRGFHPGTPLCVERALNNLQYIFLLASLRREAVTVRGLSGRVHDDDWSKLETRQENKLRVANRIIYRQKAYLRHELGNQGEFEGLLLE